MGRTMSADWIPEPEAQSQAPRVAVIEWKRSLLRNADGNIKPLLANALAALRHAPTWQDIFAFDEFAIRTVTQKAVPWNPVPHVWEDAEDILLTEWLQREGIQVSRETTGQAVEAVAHERRFHPVRQYLEGLHWDGVSRIGNWLQSYLGAPADPDGGADYVAAVGSRWLISAVARALQPGCKADCALILEGPQGIYKSTALRTLAGKWFADEIADLGSKDAAMQTSGVWIIEIAELDAMSRAETSRIKAFMSRAVDHFRPPYGKRIVDLPRQCIFAGSVNHSAYLRDETGGRRFWPVVCGTIDVDALARDRDQLWAEAVVYYLDGVPWWLETEELVRLAAGAQAARYDTDVWDSLVLEWADTRVKGGMDSISIPEVFELCLLKKPGQWNRADEMRVARGLKAGGWVRYRDYKRNAEHRYRRVVTNGG